MSRPPASKANHRKLSLDRPKRRYASSGMRLRRQRVLEEAAQLLERGIEGVTIRELARRAKVSTTTLYSAFGSKEEIIALAIEQRHQSIMSQQPKQPGGEASIEKLFRYDAIANGIAAMPGYAAAMATTFFSTGSSNPAYEVLRKISLDSSGGWLQRAEASGIVRRLPANARERILSLTINTSYAAVIDWSAGRVTLEELRVRLKSNFLTCIYAVIEPAHRKAALGMIAPSS